MPAGVGLEAGPDGVVVAELPRDEPAAGRGDARRRARGRRRSAGRRARRAGGAAVSVGASDVVSRIGSGSGGPSAGTGGLLQDTVSRRSGAGRDATALGRQRGRYSRAADGCAATEVPPAARRRDRRGQLAGRDRARHLRVRDQGAGRHSARGRGGAAAAGRAPERGVPGRRSTAPARRSTALATVPAALTGVAVSAIVAAIGAIGFGAAIKAGTVAVITAGEARAREAPAGPLRVSDALRGARVVARAVHGRLRPLRAALRAPRSRPRGGRGRHRARLRRGRRCRPIAPSCRSPRRGGLRRRSWPCRRSRSPRRSSPNSATGSRS